MTSTLRRRWLFAAAGALALGTAASLALVRQGGLLQGDGRDAAPVMRADGTPDTDYAGLAQQVRRSPRDARAWVLKARADMAAGRHELAVQAYARAMDVGPKVAKDAGVWLEYAEAQGMLQGGRLAGQPRALVERALAINPIHPQALDLAGSAAWESGDFAAAVSYWQRLQQQLAADDPRQRALQRAVETAQRQARLSLPAAAPPRQP
jgi:cytochrome c-type biogenesis protein CcmH/NrfG